MKVTQTTILIPIALVVILASGCASKYSDLVSGNNLGAQEYRPAVLVKEGKQAIYDQALPICRQVAVNRQITAAQEAQLRTITGAVSGTASAAAQGAQFGSMMKSIGIGSGQVTRGALMGASVGLITSLADRFASGTEDTAAETRAILLRCLRTASNGNWTVLE